MSISSITASRTCSESGFTSDLVPENTKDETSEHRSTVLVKSRTDTRRAAGMLGEQGLHAVPQQNRGVNAATLAHEIERVRHTIDPGEGWVPRFGRGRRLPAGAAVGATCREAWSSRSYRSRSYRKRHPSEPR